MRYIHEALFTCPNEECNNQWEEDVTDDVDFPYYDCSGLEAVTKECPECRHKNIWGEVLSTEDLDWNANQSAAIAEGREDNRRER